MKTDILVLFYQRLLRNDYMEVQLCDTGRISLSFWRIPVAQNQVWFIASIIIKPSIILQQSILSESKTLN